MKYDNYKNNIDNITLSDRLSIDRTILAIERTHLAYMRTVVSFIVAALTLFKLLGGIEGIIVASILLVSTVYFFLKGKKIYKESHSNLNFDEYEL